MRSVSLLPALVLTVPFGVARAQFTLPAPATGPTAVAAQVAFLRQIWVDDLEAHRPLSLLAHYAPDAMLLDSDGTRADGARAIRSHFEALFANANIRLQMASHAVAEAGDFAYDSGSYTEQITNDHSALPHRLYGDYLTIYRRSGAGSWQIVQQAWTAAPETTPQ